MNARLRLVAETARAEPLHEEPGPGATRCLGLYAKLAAGVTVVTARGEDGPLGMTVSAVTSLSARPPLLLACLRDGSRTLAAVLARRAFAVHLLREDQRDLAARFASPTTPAADRFAGTDPRQILGVPVLTGTLAWSVCLTEAVHPYGDHHLVIGRIAAVHVGTGRPLLWHDRHFAGLTVTDAPAAPRPMPTPEATGTRPVLVLAGPRPDTTGAGPAPAVPGSLPVRGAPGHGQESSLAGRRSVPCTSGAEPKPVVTRSGSERDSALEQGDAGGCEPKPGAAGSAPESDSAGRGPAPGEVERPPVRGVPDFEQGSATAGGPSAGHPGVDAPRAGADAVAAGPSGEPGADGAEAVAARHASEPVVLAPTPEPRPWAPGRAPAAPPPGAAR